MTGSRGDHGGHAIGQASRKPQFFASYDLAAARRYDAWYDTPDGRHVAAVEESALAEMLGRLPEARTLLDVGCGTGHFTRWLSAQGLEVVGLDASPSMLEVASGRDKGAKYVNGSAEHLPFPDGSVDLVAFITSLEFTSDPVVALREASRVARQGLLLGVLNAISPIGLGRKARALFASSPYRDARFYTPWSLARIVSIGMPGRMANVTWRTALWPHWVPVAAQRLPFGAFVAAAVVLRPLPQ